MSEQTIFREERNCWKVTRSPRAAFLIDAVQYYPAVTDAMQKAQHSIFILGWDINSKMRLRGEESREAGMPLGDFLHMLVQQNEDLHVYLLDWDFAFFYIAEREAFPELSWRIHQRIHFKLDDTVPPGGAHHQKIVVVDDAIAFAGGFDLAAKRWDTQEHLPQDTRRVSEHGEVNNPVHDVQMMVDGETASALAELVRARWEQATGERVPPAPDVGDLWPPFVPADLENVDVAVSRTVPKYQGKPEIREVESLYLDMIGTAERFIYIENQYTTSDLITLALAERLSHENSPEVILIVHQSHSAWKEEATMGVLRLRLIDNLRAADRYGKFSIYCPIVNGQSDPCINIHSKVMIVDDRIVRVGSSNLSNRSMGLDSECDLAVDAVNDSKLEEGVRHFRRRLLAEHLGCSIDELARAERDSGSLRETIEKLRGRPHTLCTFTQTADELLERAMPKKPPFDWDRPVTFANLAKKMIFDPHYRFFALFAAAAAVLIGTSLYRMFSKRR